MTALPTYCTAALAGLVAQDRGRMDEWLEAVEAGADEGLLADATAMIEARYSWRGEPAALSHSPPSVQALGLPRQASSSPRRRS